MEVWTKPELTHKTVGKSIKVVQITALAGMDMPLHHNTKETVIVVHEGEAILKTQHKELVLKKGATLLVPAYIDHCLRVIHDFKAVAIMQINSEKNFNYI
ncbi:cupin domain-containing protein [Arenibacter certesii]|uniref:Cupin type-2 domain-containing protein n=1 Tax=Arenibacter certesii TaxID=228955 RepID=A0A918ILV9_9FLAO|nr:cupin domain-containing protein [Arenibacter certesii]GGW22238.1 hypothetical protein GCM10007383_01950 [Arenibacter certesii]